MKKILFLFLAISIVSCKKKETEEASKPGVKLYQIASLENADNKYTDSYYVVSHPKGNLIWDAGLPEKLIDTKSFYDPTGVYAIQKSDSFENQLKTIGFKIDDINYFSMSHAYFNHTDTINTETWLVQENEKNSGSVASKNLHKIKGDYDVFGDGTVVIKHIPGYTTGHQVLYIEVAGLEKPILLTGDYLEGKNNEDPFNFNPNESLKKMELFEALVKGKNAEIIIQNSQNGFEKLEKLLKK
jgi:N-acyl homoserine lactone hydrolase